jgi:hypothetical protein
LPAPKKFNVLYLENIDHGVPHGTHSAAPSRTGSAVPVPRAIAEPSAHKKHQASTATRNRYSAIVLSDSSGWGLKLAQLIPRSMREHTLVVFENLTTPATQPYRALGYSRFGVAVGGKDDYTVANFLRDITSK